MPTLSGEIALQIWERGQHCDPATRALRLLAIALPDEDAATLAAFDVALRDWHLLRFRRALFGSALSGCTECPHCGERLEFEFDASALEHEGPPAAAPSYTSRTGRRYRLPNAADLVAAARVRDVDAAAQLLFARCSLDEDAATGESDLFAEVDAGLAALASERDLQLRLFCDLCGKDWCHPLDPDEFLWSEIAAHAAGLLDDVHRLAGAYGWAERDILAMSPARRAAYASRVE